MTNLNNNDNSRYITAIRELIAKSESADTEILNQKKQINTLNDDNKQLRIDLEYYKSREALLLEREEKALIEGGQYQIKCIRLEKKLDKLSKERDELLKRAEKAETLLDLIGGQVPLHKVYDKLEDLLGEDYLEVITSPKFLKEREEASKNLTNFSTVSFIAENKGLNVGDCNDLDNIQLSRSLVGREVRRVFITLTGLEPLQYGTYIYWDKVEAEIVAIILDSIFDYYFS